MMLRAVLILLHAAGAAALQFDVEGDVIVIDGRLHHEVCECQSGAVLTPPAPRPPAHPRVTSQVSPP